MGERTTGVDRWLEDAFRRILGRLRCRSDELVAGQGDIGTVRVYGGGHRRRLVRGRFFGLSFQSGGWSRVLGVGQLSLGRSSGRGRVVRRVRVRFRCRLGAGWFRRVRHGRTRVAVGLPRSIGLGGIHRMTLQPRRRGRVVVVISHSSPICSKEQKARRLELTQRYQESLMHAGSLSPYYPLSRASTCAPGQGDRLWPLMAQRCLRSRQRHRPTRIQLARLTAETTARSDAVVMEVAIPAPQATLLPTAHST